MRLHGLSSALVGLMLAGCATAPHVQNALHSELVEPYQLDAGDELRVIVFGQDDLSNTYVVDQAGNIAMPLIGNVPARGRTTGAIEQTVAAKLRAGYLRHPDVTVEVAKYRPFFVLGEVGAAGQYPFVPGMTVQQAVAIAGGFSARADMTERAGDAQLRRPRRHRQAETLRPGDARRYDLRPRAAALTRCGSTEAPDTMTISGGMSTQAD